MSREKPLSKARLHEILAIFEPGVTMEMVGGWDTGVYFRFEGKANPALLPEDGILGGRIVRSHGFCSEAIMITRDEQFGRGGLQHGLSLFFARCQERQERFERWLSSYTPPAAEEWALVKPTLGASEYVPARIIRRGKRFTFVEHLPGVEWRYTSRGLWDGFASRAAANAEIDRMREAATEHVRRMHADRKSAAE